MDTVSPIERSRIMARVKSKGNKSTESAVVALLREARLSGWRRNYPLEGKPDFVFPQKRIALFVDGCLWHGCQKHCRIPHTNRSYWIKKISTNKARDAKIVGILRVKGWVVIRIWEHEIKNRTVSRKLMMINKARSTRGHGLLTRGNAKT